MDFKKPYNRTKYISFLRNQLLPDDFEEHDEEVGLGFKAQKIRKATKIGEVSSLDLNIYEIEHESENDPRVSISRDSFRFLAHYGVQKALIIFTSKNSLNFRLSLVTVDLIWDEGKKVNKEYSNPRRYSFFLGPDTKIHTPEEYLVKQGRVKDFEDLKSRFSIEVVNKEFYTQIAILFTQLAGGTRKIGREKWDEKGLLKLPSTVDDTLRKEFTVRLIGRLVFCWFLKKKKSEKGVTLLPEKILSSEAISKTRNFYHSILEPLFFAVLNTPVEERSKKYNKLPWSQVPFLNGGLFTPGDHDFYDVDELGTSKHLNTLIVPDQWLKKLFEVFETYNFTIDENTSVDVELSIEPEMLGRIFENLLAEINPETGETARKATGSYYTPRPIVEYMVDQSLKQYLLTKTQIKEDKLDSLLSYENEKAELSTTQKESVLDALDNIKIIDPACGSGAFPMGILQKMLLILQKVDPESKSWLSRQLAKIDNKVVKKELEKKLKRENWDYVHKLGIIQSSIYGVDIQPIAVEISKLRFFLSLIVDESIDDTKPNRGIVPLPNLEFKFVAANSLIGLPEYKKEESVGLFEATDDIAKLKELRDSYFTSYGEEKKRIEKEFEETQKRMFQHSIDWQTTDSQTMTLSQWNPFSDKAASWFDPEWMFGIKTPSPPGGEGGGEGGFDIVLGNPPYIGFHGIDKQLKQRLKKIYISANGKFDLYLPFIERAYTLLTTRGFFVFICPTAFTKRDHGKKLRQFLKNNVCIKELVDFEHDQMFAGATNYTGIFSFIKNRPDRCFLTYKAGLDDNGILIEQNSLTDASWIFAGSDDAVLVTKINKDTITLGEISKISEGVVTGLNDLYLLSAEIIKVNSFELNFFAPCVRGKEIDKYNVKHSRELLFYPYTKARGKTVPVDEEILRKSAPKYYKHLKNNMDKIKNRPYFVKSKKKWYELWNQRNMDNFNCEKILTPELSEKNRFALAQEKVFYGDTVCGIVIKDDYMHRIRYKFLLAILNSKLIEWYYKKTTVPKAGGYFIYKVLFLKNVPIKVLSISSQQIIITLVDQILDAKKKDSSADTSALEKEIDQLVYKFYNLTPEEIEIVEGRAEAATPPSKSATNSKKASRSVTNRNKK
jgi:hypothetical protein